MSPLQTAKSQRIIFCFLPVPLQRIACFPLLSGLSGKIEFERCVATPEMMPIVGRAARVLGPRGLMPNAKVGSVTRDVEAAVRAAKGGQAQFRAGKNGVLHVGVGKVRQSVLASLVVGVGCCDGLSLSLLASSLLSDDVDSPSTRAADSAVGYLC